MPLLSIIIPVYNASAWLPQCLESISCAIGLQDTAQIILVNDGSTDDSGSVCDSYAQTNPAITVIHQANSGVAHARNTGLQLAQGKYIAWVDPDDYISPDWYRSICQAIDEAHPDVIFFDMRRFNRFTENQNVYGRDSGLLDSDLFLSDLYRDIRMLSGLPNKVIRAELYSDVYFDPALPILEDFAAMPQIMANAQSFYYIPKCLYHYRQHGNSLLHSVTPDRAFLSFRIACDRVSEVPSRFRQPSETAALMQAYYFCYNHSTLPDFRPAKDQLQQCRSYIFRHFLTFSSDPEIGAITKLKVLLTASGIIRLKYLIKRGNQDAQI